MPTGLYLWPDNPALSIAVLAIVAVLALFGARTAAHRAIRSAARALWQGCRLTARSVLALSDRMAARNREVLLAGGLESTDREIQQERLEEAVVQFENAAEQATDSDLKSDAYFNLGNAYLEAQQFDKSVESYIKALQADPDDMDTKKNLTFALQQLKQQQQQQQQQQQNEQSKQNEEQEEEQEQQQQQQQQQKEQDEPQQQPQPQEQELSSDEAEELLRIIESEDQKVQGKLRKADKGKKKPKKDW